MKRSRLLFFIPIIALSCTPEKCNVPQNLTNKIEEAVTLKDYTEADFYEMNDLLVELQLQDSLRFLKDCHIYQDAVATMFDSEDDEKRLLAYRLIDAAVDSSYNDRLIERINSDETTMLKTWSSSALLTNRVARASDDLFVLYAACPEGLPVEILMGMYASYDTVAVKKTSWKFIDSKDRGQQILAIQCLANCEKNEKLQAKLLQFLAAWEDENKGWVITAMSMQKMGNLQPVLSPYLHMEHLQFTIINALKESPTVSDRTFAAELEAQNELQETETL